MYLGCILKLVVIIAILTKNISIEIYNYLKQSIIFFIRFEETSNYLKKTPNYLKIIPICL